MSNTQTTVTHAPEADGRPRVDGPYGLHLDSEIYHSPQIAELERRRIFLKEWLCVAREEEIEEPRDYMALRLAGESIVLTRGPDGTVHAFMNMCLHRGAEVAYGRGNARAFVCPYHAWTFDTEGKLRGAARAGSSGIDIADCRLPELQVQTWRGWVFVNFDEDARPFEDFIRQWESELWYYQAGRCRLAYKTETVFQCNWKYVVENVMDFYHAGTVHAATFGKQFDFKSGPLPLKELKEGGLAIQFGTDTRKNDPPFFPLLPWLRERPDFAAGKAAIFPNMNLFSNTDSLRTSTFWPLDVDRMQINLYFLLPEEFFELPDYEERIEKYRALTKAIAEEDRGLMESMQRTSTSAFFKPGPVVDLEYGIRHMQDHYCRIMGL